MEPVSQSAQRDEEEALVPPEMPPEPPKNPLRAWMFLHFNYTDEVEAEYKKIAERDEVVRMVIGREICPKTGTPHLQCYIKFNRGVRFDWLRNYLPAGSSGYRARWCKKECQATSYCAKDGSLVVDKGVDSDAENRKRSRDEEAEEIISEIERGLKYGQVRNRHKVFCFWYRRQVIDYIGDELKYARPPTSPTSEPE